MAERKLIRYTFLLSLWLVCRAYSNVPNDIFEIHPLNTSVNEGESVVMDCKVMVPLRNCWWTRDTNKYNVVPNTTVNYTLVDKHSKGQCSMKIEAANINKDDGAWICHVITESDIRNRSHPGYLIVQTKPSHESIFEGSENITNKSNRNVPILAENNASIMSCISKFSNPPTDIIWLMDYNVIPSAMEINVDPPNTKTFTVISRLQFIVKEEYHQKVIACQISHPTYEQPHEETFTLFVEHPTTSVTLWPEKTGNVHEAAYNLTINEGYPEVIECEANGFPEPSYYWEKILADGKTQNISQEKRISLGFEVKEEGTYRCLANNILNSEKVASDQDIHIILEYATTNVSTLLVAPKIIKEGSNVTLSCKANGFPQPKIKWLKGSGDPIIPVSDGEKLQILNFSSSDEGHYTCRAFNFHNKREIYGEVISLQINGKKKGANAGNSNYFSARNWHLISIIFCTFLYVF